MRMPIILGHLQNTFGVMRRKLIVIVFLTDGMNRMWAKSVWLCWANETKADLEYLVLLSKYFSQMFGPSCFLFYSQVGMD
mmetsp:Transcript_32492/g.95786  ORF Transcript_32492/g.95786 Transcript_32492/m.95786 type:complete len:80 (+) Transcript_32492:299-538(+)